MVTNFTPLANLNSSRETTFLNRNRMSNFNQMSIKASLQRMYTAILMLCMFFGANNSFAQDVVNSNPCGEDAIIQTFIRGVEGSAANRITIPSINGFNRAYAEIWITSSECNSGFPSTLELTSNTGQVLNATPTDIVDPGSGEQERVYRAVFTSPLTSFEVTDLNGCDDVVSMTLSVESQLENSASFLVQFNRELDGPASNGDDYLI